MENATKALVVAGAILVAIMLISVGMIIVNSTKGVMDQGTQSGKIMEMQMFNSKFEAYEGKRTGAEIKQLINLVRTSNATNPEHQIRLYSELIENPQDLVNSKIYTIKIVYATESKAVVPNSGCGNVIVGPLGSLQMEVGYIFNIFINN